MLPILNILGFNITRSPKLAVDGTLFAARSASNRLNEPVLARAGVAPSSMAKLDQAPGQLYPTKQPYEWSGDLEDRAIRGDPRELWYLALPNKLTPQQCLQILRAALGGDLWQQWQLLSLMSDTWPVFRMAAHQLREAVAYARFNVVPYAEEGSEPSDEAKEKAGLVNRAFKAFKPNAASDEKGFSGFAYDMLDAMLNGVTMCEISWTRDEHGWMPRASSWVHPRHFTFSNDGLIALTDDRTASQFGMLSFAERRALPGGVNPNKFIVGQFMSRSGSALGAGFMRPLVWYWAARQWNQEWMLNTAKQFGSPFIDITYVPGKSDAEERAKLMAFTKNAGPERRLIHPEGTKATIHPPMALGSDNPQRYLSEEADKMALFLLLGQETTTKSIPGQLGGGDLKMDVKQERVYALSCWLARNPIRQLARAILRLNYGNEHECPEIVPDFTRPLTSVEVGQIAGSVCASGLIVRADEFYKKIGFTQPEVGDLVMNRGQIEVMLSEEDRLKKSLLVQQAELQVATVASSPEQANQGIPGVDGGREGKLKKDEVEATEHVWDVQAVRSRLSDMSNEQLKAMEELVVQAEGADKLNGEWEAIKERL